jgi:hypothetical protein
MSKPPPMDNRVPMNPDQKLTMIIQELKSIKLMVNDLRNLKMDSLVAQASAIGFRPMTQKERALFQAQQKSEMLKRARQKRK